MTEEVFLDSDSEYIEQKDLAGKRVEHIKIVQDKLKTHLSNLEAINSILEQKANNTKDPAEKIKLLKSMTFNYDKLLKLYEVYQTYESVIQKYYSNITDIITRKYRTQIELKKSEGTDDSQKDFFKRLTDAFTNGKINSDDVKIDDPKFNLYLF